MTKIKTNFDAIARSQKEKYKLPRCCMDKFLELEEKFGNVLYFDCDKCDRTRRLTRSERKYLLNIK